MNFRAKYRFFYILLTGFLLLVLPACSTKKNKFLNRTYHSTTTRFNGYFYAKESVREAVDKLVKSHEDNYNRILPITVFPNDDNAKDLYPEMDRAFEKCSKVIERHSMNIRGKEYNKWIKDNYLLIGITHFYKRDFLEAITAFEYVAKQYKNEVTRVEALIWLLRSYNHALMKDEAEKIIDILENEKKIPIRQRQFYAIVSAEYYLSQEDYEKTERDLLTALRLEENIKFDFWYWFRNTGRYLGLYKKKPYKARKKFVLAQVYQEMGDDIRANRFFNEVIKMNPNYEMVFHAKILQAKSFNVSPRKREEIREMLTKMLKDIKNDEYQDQIYYALGEIAEFEEEVAKAKEFYRKSIDASVSNQKQKGMSYLKLADIHFGDEEYKYAQVYYDSAFPLLPEDFPDYLIIENKKNSLNDLVMNLNTIEREDSLQMVANMSETEREKFIEKLIEDYEEELKRQEELQRQQELMAENQRLNAAQSSPAAQMGFGGGDWYFYNEAVKGLGMAEFTKKWGKRPLEDNWRRSNKSSMGGGFGDDGEDDEYADGEEEEERIDPKTTIEYYLKGLPLDDSTMQASHDMVIEAHYNVANIFKENLKDYKRGIQYYEKLIKRYPENIYKLPSYYQLYRANYNINDMVRADYYKNILLSQYPDSKYSKIINDPDYDVDRRPDLEQAEIFYEITFNSYKESDYLTVLDRCEEAEAKYFETDYAPKFAMLKALSKGKIYGRKFLIQELETIIEDFPSNEVSETAEEMLLTIRGADMGKGADEVVIEDNEFIYDLDKTQKHKCMIIFPSNSNSGDAKIAVSDFNKQYFRNENLSIISLFLDADTQILVVNGLKNFVEAKKYHKAIKDNESVRNKTSSTKHVYVISDDNFKIFFKDKGIEQYEEFFQKYYLNLN